MPTKRHIRWRHRRETPFDDEKREILMSGLDFFGYGGLFDEQEREAAMRHDWFEHVDELLAAFIQDHPGSRPWAWWRYSTPEPRRRVKAGGIVVMPHMTALEGDPLTFGLPRRWICGDPVEGENRFETQAEYLKRLKLLATVEKRESRNLQKINRPQR